MIFDFYENFSNLYPLKKEGLLHPDREKFGYYWDFEDFLIKDEKGKGLVLQGFMLSSADDLSTFSRMFDRAFLTLSIGSIIKNAFSDFVLWDSDLRKNLEINTVSEIKADFLDRMTRRDEFLSSLNSSLKKGNIWIATNSYWSILVKKDIEGFWGSGVEIKTLPDDFSIMNRKDVWEEVDLLGPLEFEPEMAWQELSFSYPNLVKYIDEETRQKSGIDFLDQCHGFGLI